ncbi:MAG: serine/threonine protein kinase [bacterium]|nr:serine/threonine protein kinase [Candidatus Kapabacteria bacterium]
MADDSQIPPQRSVNGYEILDLIAVGGMSRVYRAQNAQGEIVAMKVIQFDEMASDYERRLRREPEIHTGIGHANIVRLIDWFRIGGEFFLAMEFVDGRSLWSIIHDEIGALPFERARKYMRDVIPAVAHLHDIGIIHRDIKPANILVAHDDTTKLADFGIAKFTWQQGQTRTQLGLGTPEYMSPEQARGVGIDHRTDIYSLGITFFEMLTKHPPFVRDRATPAAYSEIIQGILSSDIPDPRTIQPDLPGGAAAFIARATAKDPKDRFASAVQMLRALDAISSEEHSPATIIPSVNDRHSVLLASAPAAEPPRRVRAIESTKRDGAAALFRKRPVVIALAILLVTAASFAASKLLPGSNASNDTVAIAKRDTPDDIARRAASSYRVYSRAHSLESLASMYAPVGVKYFNDGTLIRDSILSELRDEYSSLALTDSFAVDVDSASARGDTAVDIVWRTRYGRMRNDSSRFIGTTRENLRLKRVGESWMIIEHDRRLLTGVAPDGPRPRITKARTSPTSRASRATTPTRQGVRLPISVRLDRGIRIDLGRKGDGRSKAKKRRNK